MILPTPFPPMHLVAPHAHLLPPCLLYQPTFCLDSVPCFQLGSLWHDITLPVMVPITIGMSSAIPSYDMQHAFTHIPQCIYPALTPYLPHSPHAPALSHIGACSYPTCPLYAFTWHAPLWDALQRP